MEVDQGDVIEALELVQEVPLHSSSVIDTVQNLLKNIRNNDLQMNQGISFLDVKCQSLLSYIINLTYVILKKLCGKKLESDPSVERLVELRTVLEKLKPLDERLKYQINKLLSTIISGSFDAKDPLRFKANPDSLANEEVNGENSDAGDRKTNIYVPPKISASYYEEDDNLEVRKKKILDRAQKRALSSNVVYELRKEYDPGPEEIKESFDPHKMKLCEEMKERAWYEEEYMLRLPLTKKQKHDIKHLTTATNFNTKFDDVSALELGTEDMSLKNKIGKKKFRGKRGKKGFKRKRR